MDGSVVRLGLISGTSVDLRWDDFKRRRSITGNGVAWFYLRLTLVMVEDRRGGHPVSAGDEDLGDKQARLWELELPLGAGSRRAAGQHMRLVK